MAIQAGALIDVADFADTGWVDVTLAAGLTNVSGFTLQVRRIGVVVYAQGRIAGLTANTQTTITASPHLSAEFRPVIATWELGPVSNGGDPSTDIVRVAVNSSGSITCRTQAGTQAFIFGSWLAD